MTATATKRSVRELRKMLGQLVHIEWIDATAEIAPDDSEPELALCEAGGYLAHVDEERTTITIDKPHDGTEYETAGRPCFSVPTGWLRCITRQVAAESFTLKSSFSLSRSSLKK